SRSRVERPSGQAPVPLEILLTRPRDHVVGERRHGWLLVPANPLEVIADELLIETRLTAPRRVRVPGPEARRVRRQHLVNQQQLGAEQAELELRVSNDDATRVGVLDTARIELQGEVPQTGNEIATDNFASLRLADVLVVPGLG